MDLLRSRIDPNVRRRRAVADPRALVTLLLLACRVPSPGGSNGHDPGDTDTDADTDTDSDTDTDTDSDTDSDMDWGAYTGPPRLVVAPSYNFWMEEVGEWALYDLEESSWVVYGAAVDGTDLVPTCSAAWVAVIRLNGEDDEGVDLHDAQNATALGSIYLEGGRRPRAAVGFVDGDVAIGFDTGTVIDIRAANGDLTSTIDLSAYADAVDTVHVAALTWWDGMLLAVVDAGALTEAIVLGIDPSSGSVVLERPLHTFAISDEVAVVDGWLWIVGRGDSLEPGAIEATSLTEELYLLIDGEASGLTFTTASFAADGFWVAAVDGVDETSVRWVGFDGTEGPVIPLTQPVGDVAAEGSDAFWLTEGKHGHTVTRYDAGGKALGQWTFPAPAAIRSCGADSL